MDNSVIKVIIAESIICFLGQCYPALVGDQTPKGVHNSELVIVEDEQFGPEALAFAEKGDLIYAIHVAHNTNRRALLNREIRPQVTLGCVNVSRETMDELLDCCVGYTVVVE